MCGEGTGCVGVAGTVPAAGSEGACTCWEVASGDGGGGEALRRAALGVGRRARGHASGKAAVGVGGGEGGGVVAGGGERLRCGGCWGGGGECSLEGRDPATPRGIYLEWRIML